MQIETGQAIEGLFKFIAGLGGDQGSMSKVWEGDDWRKVAVEGEWDLKAPQRIEGEAAVIFHTSFVIGDNSYPLPLYCRCWWT